MQHARKEQIRAELERVRLRTLYLFTRVPDETLRLRVHDFYSPIGWHFGHIGMTEELWTCGTALGQAPIDPQHTHLFANIPDNPKDQRVHLPDRSEIVDYLAVTRRATLDALETADLSSSNPLLADGYAWEFALQHECQHQETIIELLQLLQKREALNSGRWGVMPLGPEFAHRFADRAVGVTDEMIPLPGGRVVIGSNDRHGYDNERCEHIVELHPFHLDRSPVTSSQWMDFLRADGYGRQELWSAEGWAWRTSEAAAMPEYWVSNGEAISYCAADGLRQIDPSEPVTALSWYEADAYARWTGKRLPTEAELEFAAGFDPKYGRMRCYPWGDEETYGSQTAIAGIYRSCEQTALLSQNSAWGVRDIVGSVWCWTSSTFMPYPGFEAYPYDGYSKDHMDGCHYVCRAGSRATDRRILRCSFRNWYVPTYRQGLLGMRCAL